MKLTYSMPLMNSYKSGLSGRKAVTDLAPTGSFCTSRPAMVMVPSVKPITPATARRVVVLPAPLRPMKPQISPGETWRVRSSTAVLPPG